MCYSANNAFFIAVFHHRNRKDAHQCAISIIHAGFATTFQRISSVCISHNRPSGTAANIKNFATRGVFIIKEPHTETFHNIYRINRFKKGNAVKRCQCHAAIVRPCAGLLIVRSIACHRPNFESVTLFELNGNT